MLSELTGHLPEIIIVLVVILIIWGPGKLPDVGAAMGKGIREFRKASAETHRLRDGHEHDGNAGARPRTTGPSGSGCRGTRAGRAACGAGHRPGRHDDTPALSLWLTRPSGAR